MDQVVEAISAGVRQIVILGAGYDDRALRFRTPGVRFFEVDHPNTQQDKLARLAKLPGMANTEAVGLAGPVLVAADFRVDALPDVLAAAGHDRAAATLFLCEGLLVYLDEPATVGLLGGAREVAGPGSVLAASLAVHADGLDSALVLEVANARRRTAERRAVADHTPGRSPGRAAGQGRLDGHRVGRRRRSRHRRDPRTVTAGDRRASPGRQEPAAPRETPAGASPGGRPPGTRRC